MQKQIEKDILNFSNSTGYGTDFDVVHGSVYANFKNAQDAKWYQSALELFMNEDNNSPVRVNIYKLWKANEKDVYVFDIVEHKFKIPSTREDSDVDVMLNLEAESRVGK
jgi:flagellar hook protein FlgE